MNKEEVRLECLKLVFRKDLHPEESLKSARILEAYVLGEGPEAEQKEEAPKETEVGKAKPGRPKKSGNSNIFD